MKIEFYGYNDSRTLAFYNAIIMLQIFIACLIVSLLTIPFAIVFSIYEILYIFIIPGFFLFLVPISYLINVKYKTFLKGLKVKHKFTLESGYLFKDNNLQYAIEKERLSRIKHDEGEPIEGIEYILKAANLKQVVYLHKFCNMLTQYL